MPPNNTFTAETTGSRGVMAPTATSISDDELVKEISNAAEQFYFQRAELAIAYGAAYGGFIILTAALHHLAGFLHGAGGINGPEFNKYCTGYLNHYDADALWEGLRCGFFHRGVPQSGFRNCKKGVVVVANHPENHDPKGDKEINEDCITLDVGEFLKDLRFSFSKLLKDVQSNQSLKQKCQKAWEQFGIVAT